MHNNYQKTVLPSIWINNACRWLICFYFILYAHYHLKYLFFVKSILLNNMNSLHNSRLKTTAASTSKDLFRQKKEHIVSLFFSPLLCYLQGLYFPESTVKISFMPGYPKAPFHKWGLGDSTMPPSQSALPSLIFCSVLCPLYPSVLRNLLWSLDTVLHLEGFYVSHK